MLKSTMEEFGVAPWDVYHSIFCLDAFVALFEAVFYSISYDEVCELLKENVTQTLSQSIPSGRHDWRDHRLLLGRYCVAWAK